MTENFRYSGTWFRPQNKQDRRPGILTYDKEDGCTLEIFGNFNDNWYPNNLQEDILLGITNDSREITLYNSFIFKSGGAKLITGKEVGIPSTFYRVNFCLDGIHAESEEQLKFSKICCKIFNFEEWINIDGFTTVESKVTDDLDNIRIKIDYTSPASIPFTVTQQLNGSIRFNVSYPFKQEFQKQACIVQNNDVVISSDNEYSMDELLELTHIFQNFLTLALYSRTYPLKTYLYKKDTEGYSKVELYYPIRGRYKQENAKIVENLLFYYIDIKEDFSQIMENWFQNYKKLRLAFNLIFEQFYSTERFSINNFLNLAQGAEALHKGAINSNDSIKFKPRLEELVSKYFLDCLNRLIPDKIGFIEQIKNTRNYYTHYTPKLEARALKGTPLRLLTGRLQVLLICGLLIEAGIKKEKLNSLFEARMYKFFNNLIVS